MNDRRIGLTVLTLVLAGCIDVEGGQQGTYTSPCGTFGGLLLCGRESGGADPKRPDAGVGAARCAEACQVVVTCSFDEDLASCLFECENQDVPQDVLDCIVANGCAFPKFCFGPID